MQLQLPPLPDGETYVATLFDAEKQTGYHLVLLPGDNDDSNWQTQTEWAASIGGELPTRVEQALLWEKHRDKFEDAWYWSSESHASDPAYAWYQGFDGGLQFSIFKSSELRARAVRRLPI